MHFLFKVTCVSLITFNVASSETCPGPTSTPQGDIQCTWKTTINNRKVRAFMGIPFAKPPVGPLRFKNPEPFGKWTSILEEQKDPPPCPQIGKFLNSSEDVIGNENCLYLNVYTPNIPGNEKLPVMVYIYGGSFYSGACDSRIYGPDMLLDKDIVLVVPNYRIGILGFGSTEDEELPGNLGLKDQVLALKWVQENIASYGGNPDNVTIFGESAGAASVHHHMLSPLSKGLFHRAIPMSGSAFNPWAIAAPGVVANFVRKFGEKVKCPTSSTKELIGCLSQVPVTCLVATATSFAVWEGLDPSILFKPVFEQEGEKSFITAESYKQFTTLPMMIGATTEEGAFRIAGYALSPVPLDDILSKLNKDFDKIGPFNLLIEDKADNPAEVAMQIKHFFFGDKDISKDTIPELINMYSDVFFYEGIKIAVKRHNNTAFLYSFGYAGPFSFTQAFTKGQCKHGVSHADDLQYLFPMKGIIPRTAPFNDEEKKVSRELIDYFVNFATHGNPTPDGKPTEWTPTSKDDLNYRLINGVDLKMHNGFQSVRDNFWKNIKWSSKVIPQSD